MSRDLLDDVRLELEVEPPGGIRNRALNPSGEGGYVHSWSTGHLISGVTVGGEAALKLQGVALGSAQYPTAAPTMRLCPVTPGEYVASRIEVVAIDSPTRLDLYFVFYKADGTYLSSSPSQAVGSTLGVKRTTPVLVPASAAFAVMGIQIEPRTVAPTSSVTWRRTVLAKASTSAALANLAWIEPVTYAEVTASSSTTKIVRKGLEVGTLDTVLHDAALDQATSSAVRPGRRVRLSARSSSAAAWETVFRGKIRDGRTRYDEQGRARVEISAVDAAAELANTSAMVTSILGSRRYPMLVKLADLPWLLENARAVTPWDVDGNKGQVTTEPPQWGHRDGASVLEVAAIATDTARGHAYVTREGVLKIRTGAAPAPSRTITDDPTAYAAGALSPSSLEVDYSTDLLVNEVTIAYLRPSTTEDGGVTRDSSEEVLYGPYRGTASVNEWGAYAATYTYAAEVENAVAIEAHAAAILAANATPTKRPRRVVVPVKRGSDLAAVAATDLGDVLTVTWAGGVNGSYRLEGLEHEIAASVDHGLRWKATYDFDPSGAVGQPVALPTGGGGGGGGAAGGELVQSGTVATGTMAAATENEVAVTFPVPYASTPTVATSIQFGTTGGGGMDVTVSPTSTGVTLNYRRQTGTGGFTIHWIAHGTPA